MIIYLHFLKYVILIDNISKNCIQIIEKLFNYISGCWRMIIYLHFLKICKLN